jgi:hypothetical protein
MTDVCQHTYLRWVNKKAVCAVCSKGFYYDYDDRFPGTFSRKDLEKAIEFRPVVNSTSSINRPMTWRLDE